MDKTKLTLGSGEVYFDRFETGTTTPTGERYIGNTTEFDIERKLSFTEARKSLKGVKVKSTKNATSEDVMLSFRTDNMSDENVADWLGAEYVSRNITGVGAQSETFVLIPGRFYQLGLATYPGVGVSDVFGMSIKANGVFLTDCYVDEPSGRFGIPLGRTDLTGDTATVEYEIRTSKSTIIKPMSLTVHGSLRFIARNLVGNNENYFFPHVVLTPTDKMKMKDPEWRSLSFEGESLAPYTVYSPRTRGRSPGEQALIDEDVDPTGFVVIEGVLDDALIGG